MDPLSILIGLIAGLALGFVLARVLFSSKAAPDSGISEREIDRMREDYFGMKARLEEAKEEIQEKALAVKEVQEENIQLNKQIGGYQEEVKAMKEKLDNQLKEVEELQKRFATEFENMANKIFEEKSKKFTSQNLEGLEQILNPLKDRIKDFETKVDKKYLNEAEGRAALAEKIKALTDLNQEMQEEAKNLTKALKGDSKAQGNWGEVVLEKILENSGLIKGEGYHTQYSTHDRDGSLIQPDVVVNFPDGRHVVVDSKVSLTAYESYVSAEDEKEQKVHLKQHVNSVRNHIKALSDKNYQTGKGLDSPDFVLMFVPIEASFSLAMKEDPNLYSYAWDRKIVIVSPSTLLATLRTIASVWDHERQTKNAIEIADEAGKLYDKFVGFLEDMEKIDRALGTARTTYDDAMNKLQDGRGNIIGRTEKIKRMGAKAKKSIPEELRPEDANDRAIDQGDNE